MNVLIGTTGLFDAMEKGFAFVHCSGAPKPEKYFWAVQLHITRIRARLEQVGFAGINVMWGQKNPQLEPQWFHVNCATRKDMLTGLEAVRLNAAYAHAEFVSSAADAWGVKPEKMRELDSILKQYGSIANCPFREDVVSFSLETREGVWQASVPVEPTHSAASGKTFGHVSFIYAVHSGGHLARLLPGSNRAR